MVFTHATAYFSDQGNGKGISDMTGDYSGIGNEKQFFIQTPEDPVGPYYDVARVTFQTCTAIQPRMDFYGGVQALVNGIKFNIYDDKGILVFPLAAGIPIRTLGELRRACATGDELNATGPGARYYVATWNFLQAYGRPIRLLHNWKLALELNDDFSASGANLIEHRAIAQGVTTSLRFLPEDQVTPFRNN